MNVTEARDAMFGVFNKTWDEIYPVVWGTLPGTPPASETPWARVTVKHSGGGQSSLSGETGARRFKRYGILRLSLYVPAEGDQVIGYDLAQKVANAYEDARLDVWFRNIRIREQGICGAFEQIDVLADFLYDEVR